MDTAVSPSVEWWGGGDTAISVGLSSPKVLSSLSSSVGTLIVRYRMREQGCSPSPGLHVHDVQGVFQEAGLELIVLLAAGCQ